MLQVPASVKSKLFNIKLKDLIFIGLVIFIAGYFLTPNGSAHHRIYYALVLAPMLFLGWGQLFKPFRENALIKLCYVFIVYMAMTRLWPSGEGHKPIYKSFVYGVYIISFLTVLYLTYTEKNSHKESYINIIIIIIGLLSAAVSLFSYFDHVFISEDVGKFYRLTNVLAGDDFNPSPSGRYFGFAALFSLLYLYGGGYKKIKVLAVISFASCLLALLLAHGRGPMLGFGLAFIVVISLAKNRKAVYLLILAVVLVSLYSFMDLEFLQRLVDRGSSHRLDIYKAVFTVAMETPYWGRGLTASTYKLGNEYGNHCHSVFLAVLVYGGFVGLILFSLVLSLSYKFSWKVFKHNGDIGPIALLTYGIGCYLFDGDKLINHPKGEWLLIWLPIAYVAAKYSRSCVKSPDADVNK